MKVILKANLSWLKCEILMINAISVVWICYVQIQINSFKL
jgi:hypothetical protein